MGDPARKHDELARAIDLLAEVTRIVNGLRVSEAPHEYTQDSPPPGMSKRTYMDHCYARDWPTRKVGRLRVTTAADYDEWRATRSQRPARLSVVEDDADADTILDRLGAK